MYIRWLFQKNVSFPGLQLWAEAEPGFSGHSVHGDCGSLPIG